MAKKQEKTKSTEKTGKQGPVKPTTLKRGDFGSIGRGVRVEMPSFSTPAATLEVYEKISQDPTVILANSIITAPIRRNTWTWKKKPDAPQQWVDAAKDKLNRLRADALKYGLTALNFECAFFEQVWGREDNLSVIKKLKPLARFPATTISVDEHGNIVGLENKTYGSSGEKKIHLDLKECFIYRNNPTPEYFYGQARPRNILKPWAWGEEASDKLAQYLRKIAGIILQVHYPDGTGLDANGAPRPNFWLAEDLLEQVGMGKSVAIPNKFASFLSGDAGSITPAAIEKALASAGKSDWVLSAFDPGGADYSAGFLNVLAYYDKLKFRGYEIPERAGLEADKGGIGQGDSAEHGDLALTNSELLDMDFAVSFSEGVVDDFLVENYGEGARGSVWVEASPLADDTVDRAGKLLMAGLANPAFSAMVGQLIDWEKVVKDSSTPLSTHIGQAMIQAANAPPGQQMNALAGRFDNAGGAPQPGNNGDNFADNGDDLPPPLEN